MQSGSVVDRRAASAASRNNREPQSIDDVFTAATPPGKGDPALSTSNGYPPRSKLYHRIILKSENDYGDSSSESDCESEEEVESSSDDGSIAGTPTRSNPAPVQAKPSLASPMRTPSKQRSRAISISSSEGELRRQATLELLS